MTSTTTTSDENSTIFDHRQTQEHHHQHHEQHRTHANGTTLSRRNLHRSSSLPDVSSVTSQSQSQSQSHSHSRSGSITKTSASGSSTVSSLGNTYQSGSGPFGSFLRRHNNNSNSNIIVRQPRQRGLPANCNDDDDDDDDSGHPPSDPSSSLDPPSLTSAAIAMSPPPRGSDPAVPVRGSDPEGESDDLRSLSSMGTATFRRLRETRLASRREEKAKDSDENDDPRRRRRRRSRDDVAFDSRREISSSGGGGGNVTHRGGGVRRSPRRRRIYNERYDCDRDGDNGTVGGAIGDYDWGGDDRDDGGDGCGSSVSTEYTRNGSGATGGDSFLRDGGTSRSSSQSSSSRRHPSRDHAHSRSRSRHVPPSRSGSRGRNERLRPRGRPFDYDDDLAGDRFHRSRRGPTGYFRRVTATAFKTAVIFALGFLAMIRWELVDVDVARLFAGGGGTSSSSSFRDVKTQIQKSFQDGERNLRGHSANRRDGTDDEDGNGVVGGDQRIRGNEWLHQQHLQRLQQLQLQQQLYLQQQSQSQSRYVGQSHLSPQSTQSRNPEDGNEQKEENEDEQADSGTDEDEDEDDDDDDASGREKLENVDLHDSQDIKLYTGEIESVEETMEAKMEQDVVAEVPETDIETREGVAGEPNTQEEKTHVFENFVDAISPPHESVLLTKDGKEDEAGASSEVLHAEAENENEIMELGSEVEPEGVLDGMEGEKQQWDEETENEQTGQHLEQREESSTLDTDSIEELERLSQQSAESDLQWEVGEVNDNLVPNNIDANEIVTPQDSLAYLDKLFKLQQSDEELNYGDPQLEKQLPPPWQQQQQQQLNQHNLLDQLHENLPVEESSHGGQLQNFQNTIHQFDQQQQESILLQQQQQQQQRLNQQDFLYQLNEELPVEESSQGGQLHNIQNNIHQFDMDLLQQQQQQQRLNQHDLMDQLHEEPPVEESSQGGQPQNFQNNIHQFDMVLLQQQQQQRLDQQDLIDQLNEEPPMEESSQGSQLQNIQNTFHQFDQQQQENIMLQQQQQQLQQQQQQRLDQQDFLYQLNEELPVEESSQGGQLQNIQNSIHQFRMLLLQQQQQQQKQQLYRQGLMDQLHDGLQVEESSYGGQLQNFQNNIHQIDQQQQERTLKERSQKQQKLQSNENKINNAIVSDGSTDSFATNLFDNHAAQKPEFAVLNRDNPNDHGLAEAGVDRGSNSAKIHHPNLVYEDRYRFNRNDISDNSNNVNLVGTNFVDQNANFDSGMIQSGNYNFGDQIGFHREIDHDYNHHMIGSSGAKYFQGGGAFPDGATDDMNSSNFFNGNNEVDNVQEVGVFPDEVNGEDNYNGLSHGNNEVNNLHRDTFLNEVNDQINSGLISNEFAAKSLGFNNQGTNRQFDPVSDVQDKFAAIENQKLDNSLGKNSDATRQLDNRFLSQEIMSNSDENLIEADANLIQITASQNFELVNKNDSSKIDQFRDTSIERQRIDPLNFYINQENFGPSVDKLDGLIEVDNELPSVEFIRNTARNFNGDEIPPSNKEHDEDAFSHTIVSDGDSGAGRIVQEQAGFSQDTSIPDEEDIQEQVHLLRGADLQGQDYQAGAGSQTQGVTQQNFGFQDVSIPQEEIISQEQVLFRQEKSSQDETESREQYNYQQFDKIHDDTDFFQGSESSLEQAEPTEEINSRQTNSLHDLEDFALDARSQEEARYQRDSKGQEKNYFLQQVKHREQSNSQQVPNPMERAGFEDEADLKKLALEVKFLTEGRDYNVEEFQSHDQTEVELEEDTESMQVSENPNRNQIDFEELMDKDEVAVGNTPESNSNAIATRSVPQNRGPRAKGRDMAADIDFSPSSEQAHASYIKENSILVGETETIGEQNDQDIGSSIQLSPTLVGNDIDVDVEIGDMRRAQNSRQEVSTFLKKSERVFDFQVKPSEPGTVMEQPVDMDAYKMSTFGGLDEGLAAGTEHTFQKSQQTNGITTKEGQHPEATGLEGHKIKRQGFPSVSEYYSSIREEPARNNMITLLQKRREQRQKLRQQQ